MFLTEIIIIILLVVVGVFLFLLRNGKPDRLAYRIVGFTDSLETIDDKTGERKKLPYYAWHENDKEVELLVKGKLLYESDTLRWSKMGRVDLYFKIFNGKNNSEGIEGELIETGNSSRVFAEGYSLDVSLDEEDEFNFKIRFSKRDNNFFTKEKILIKFQIQGSFTGKSLFFNTGGSKELPYEFYLGPELGDTWVSFDPGTTGSCLAAGSPVSNGIVMEQNKGEDKVIPSILTFNTKQRPTPIKSIEDIYPLYDYGVNAAAQMSLTQNRTFQSIKKLLGYTDKKKVVFANQEILELTGSDLSTLLVAGLLRDFKKYLETSANTSSLLASTRKFNPLRAVVAVPNNYTPTKINAMLSCIRNLNQFKEIRYVTEAEAVLCYYLSEHTRLHPDRNSLTDETIMIFDMGGSTINTTVADVFLEKGTDKFQIEIDSKIGYSIGGDTIDYCLAKTIFSFTKDFPALRGFNPFDEEQTSSKSKREMVKQVQTVVFEMKKDIVKRYYDEPLVIKNPKAPKVPKVSLSEAFFDTPQKHRDYKVLLTKDEIERIIYRLSGQQVNVKDTSPIYELFKSDHKGSFPLFRNEFFQQYVYEPIKDAVTDVIGLSDGRGGYIDTVIFSGRSCLFPFIKETVSHVTSQIEHKKGRKRNSIYLQSNELKTAVARGACWYGVHKEAVEFSSSKLNSSYGVKRTKSPDKKDFDFIDLLKYGTPFDLSAGADHSLRANQPVSEKFTYDGNRVNFFQVMGESPHRILQKNQKHKFTLIASIKVPQQVGEVGIAVSPEADVECLIRTVTGSEISKKAEELKEEVVNDNEEHYTWIVS